jgi:hypothetical protein
MRAVRRLAGQLVPAQRGGGDQRSGRPPHHVLGLVGEVGTDQRLQVPVEPVSEPAGDEEDARLAREKPGRSGFGDDLALQVVGLGAPALEGGERGGRQVERRLGEPPTPSRSSANTTPAAPT